MLEEMRIRRIGVIDDAVLQFGPGLVVVTGETGAGKTMVVSGLSLLLGGRADSGLVRGGAGSAVVEGRLLLDPARATTVRALTRARDVDADIDSDPDGDVLIVSRSVSSEGRSRAQVGGRSVPVGVLAEIGADVVAIHGQADQQHLRSPTRQREALDRFAGDEHAAVLAQYEASHERLREVQAELDDVRTRGRERAREADLLRHGLNEIEAAGPQPDEDGALADEVRRLAHADALRGAAALAHDLLLGSDAAEPGAADAVGLVGDARHAVEGQRQHDSGLAALADRLAEVSYLLSDVASDLASYAAGVDTDPVRLSAAQERQAQLGGLLRRYGATVAEVLAWAKHASSRLAELEGDDERLLRLDAERDELRTALARIAQQLSVARQAAADRLGQQVTTEIAHLAMPDARVTVRVTRVEAEPDAPEDSWLDVDGKRAVFGPRGIDEVAMVLRGHADAPERPLARAASGGELSRIMLAVEVALAGADPVPTFVFDEVDAGVGGRAAVEVGRRLARLARTAQVIVVTHLPQVAAFADRHLLVAKSSDGAVTSSGVRVLEDAERLPEIARMLAGLADSELGRAHAEELLAAAEAAKA